MVFLYLIKLYICIANNENMFNKETEYALRSLVYIQMQNMNGRRPGIDEITREIDAPRFYTAKILYRMVKNGFLRSLKGKGGGFFFEDDKPPLTIKKVVLATEGGKIFSSCVFGLKQCDSDIQCPLHEKYAPVRGSIDDLVSSETIQTLAHKYSGNFKKQII